MHGFVRAGPRSSIVFHGDQVHAAIVTCGGICPGINNVIRYDILDLLSNATVILCCICGIIMVCGRSLAFATDTADSTRFITDPLYR